MGDTEKGLLRMRMESRNRRKGGCGGGEKVNGRRVKGKELQGERKDVERNEKIKGRKVVIKRERVSGGQGYCNLLPCHVTRYFFLSS